MNRNFLLLVCYAIVIIFKSDAKSIEARCDITRSYYHKIRTPLDTCLIENLTIKEKDTKLVFDKQTNNVTAITFRSSQMDVLPNELFSQFPHLIVLEMELMAINEIKENSFMNAVHLQVLDLELNRLTEISAGTFEGAWNLRDLDLSMNRISKVSSEAFKFLEKLEHVGLSANEISVLEQGTFADMRSLQSVYLYSNHLKTLSPEMFVNCENLQDLHVSENELEEVELILSTKEMSHLTFDVNSLRKLTLR